MPVDDIREVNRRAVRASVEVVSRVGPEHLDRATPCAAWTLGELLAHMTVQHRGFAAAAGGRGSDPAVWQVRPVGADPVAAYVDAADRVLVEFAADGVLQREFVLPELSTRRTFPGVRAIGFHTVDYVVHGWDVARSLGVAVELDPELVAATLRMAREVPDGAGRIEPGAAFAPAIAAPADASPLDRLVSALGRTPGWHR